MPSLANHQSNQFTKLLLIGDAMIGMRKFLFQNLYNKEEVNIRLERGKNLIKKLYEYYMETLKKEYENEEELERKVLDYISGMTDSYAITKFKEIYLP